MTKIKCTVARVEEKRIEVDGTMTVTPIVKLVPCDIVGDFYFAVAGGTIGYMPEQWIKSADGTSQKLAIVAGTVPMFVTSPDGDTFTVGAEIEVDLAPVVAHQE
jgi:hypothetical protein